MPSFLRLFGSVTTFLPKAETYVGRKLPITPLSTIKTELVEEIRHHGHEAIALRLSDEKRILADLMKRQAEHHELIRKHGREVSKFNPESSRSFESFWKEQQAVINRASSPEERELLADQIDWLLARQHLKTDLVEVKAPCRI